MSVNSTQHLAGRRWRFAAIAGWLIAFVALSLKVPLPRHAAGQSKDSPDGKSIAYLEAYQNMRVPGRDKTVWIEVYIQPKEGSLPADPNYLRFTCPDPEIKNWTYAYDGEGILSWSNDSKTVRVLLPNKELIITR